MEERRLARTLLINICCVNVHPHRQYTRSWIAHGLRVSLLCSSYNFMHFVGSKALFSRFYSIRLTLATTRGVRIISFFRFSLCICVSATELEINVMCTLFSNFHETNGGCATQSHSTNILRCCRIWVKCCCVCVSDCNWQIPYAFIYYYTVEQRSLF